MQSFNIFKLNYETITHRKSENSAPSAVINENLARVEPEPESEGRIDELKLEIALAPNAEPLPVYEEIYTTLIPADGIINEVPTGNWYNPPAKRWARSECNDSYAAEKPGPHEYVDEFLLEHIYSNEVHDDKILYSCRWLGWPLFPTATN